MTHPLVRAVRRALQDAADPAKTPQMQAYMKSAMPYRGVSGPEQRRLWRALFTVHLITTSREWQQTALALWRSAIELLFTCLRSSQVRPLSTSMIRPKSLGVAPGSADFAQKSETAVGKAGIVSQRGSPVALYPPISSRRRSAQFIDRVQDSWIFYEIEYLTSIVGRSRHD